jgi:hypothetical protein
MRWRKLGLVYVPTGDPEWAVSHPAIPTPMMLDEDRIRVYVAIRDRDNVGRVGWVDVDAADPQRLLGTAKAPALDIGTPGAFDDNGVAPTCLVEHEGRLHLFYVGFELGVHVRYRLLTGLAVSEDGGETFQRLSRAPVLDRSDAELQFRTAAHVRPTAHGTWRLWYVAGSSWIESQGKPVPAYDLRHQESRSLTEWAPAGDLVLHPAGPDEYAFGRPFVVEEDGAFRMWYSIRSFSRGYRLGYAESPDGLDWTRLDDRLGLDASPTGWDSEMQCYACVQATRHGTYLFYNGNDFGATGVGVAVLKP